jgi:Arc/MetJ family transcription regulator
MVSNMKTTIDITDALLAEARQLADQKGTTLKSLVETGLRHVIEENTAETKPFRLKKHTFKGEGLHPEVQDADWGEIRRRAYEGHGG